MTCFRLNLRGIARIALVLVLMGIMGAQASVAAARATRVRVNVLGDLDFFPLSLQPASSSALPPAAARGSSEVIASVHHVNDVTLHVVVRALPRSLSAKVVISGPHQLRKRVTHNVWLKLPAGAYTLSAGPVRAAVGAYYATTPRVHKRLRAGSVTTVTVSYATFVPKTTRVVPASGTVALVGEPSGTRVLTLTGASARDVKVGQFLASGTTGAAPDGYLIKVTKVLHNSSGTAVLDVQNATLLEALPNGEIDAEAPLGPPAEASSLDKDGALDLTFGHRGARSAHAAEFSLHTTNLTCQSGAGVHVEKPTVMFSPSIALHAHWGFFKLDSASFTVTVAASLAMGANAEAGASCETNNPGIGLLPHPISLPDIDLQVGPVPVVITPRLQVYLSGKASITAKVSVSLEQSASTTVGASYDHGSFTPIASFSQHFTPSFTAEGDASAELALTPTLDTLIYGVAGPSFDLGAVAKLNADVKKTPWWTLQGCLQAGLGFVFSPLGLNWSDPHLIQLCKTLLSATSGPPSSSGSGTPPGGGAGAGSPPGPGEPILCELAGCDGSATHPLRNVSAIADGSDGSACALVKGGTIDCWGGLLTGLESDPTPMQVPMITSAKNIAVNGNDACAVLQDGTVDCWGTGTWGQLGDGSTAYSATPVAVSGITDATAVAVGYSDACALLATGHVACWGANFYGQLGEGQSASNHEQATPVAVSRITSATAIAAGADEQVCALLASGHIDCWGHNSNGQLGDGETEGPETCLEGEYCATSPVEVSAVSNAIAITAGGNGTCALLAGGTIDCWGGLLGNGTNSESPVPVAVSAISGAVGVAAGLDDSCALLGSGTVECWGIGLFGLQNKLLIARLLPTVIGGISGAIQVEAGFGQACVVLSSGGADCVGGDLLGQLGNGFGGATAAGFSTTPVAVAEPAS